MTREDGVGRSIILLLAINKEAIYRYRETLGGATEAEFPTIYGWSSLKRNIESAEQYLKDAVNGLAWLHKTEEMKLPFLEFTFAQNGTIHELKVTITDPATEPNWTDHVSATPVFQVLEDMTYQYNNKHVAVLAACVDEYAKLPLTGQVKKEIAMIVQAWCLHKQDWMHSGELPQEPTDDAAMAFLFKYLKMWPSGVGQLNHYSMLRPLDAVFRYGCNAGALVEEVGSPGTELEFAL